jgi:hypothetical protein
MYTVCGKSSMKNLFLLNKGRKFYCYYQDVLILNNVSDINFNIALTDDPIVSMTLYKQESEKYLGNIDGTNHINAVILFGKFANE